MNILARVSAISTVSALLLMVASIVLPTTSNCLVTLLDPLGYCKGN
jgi:hypothetical protein